MPTDQPRLCQVAPNNPHSQIAAAQRQSKRPYPPPASCSLASSSMGRPRSTTNSPMRSATGPGSPFSSTISEVGGRGGGGMADECGCGWRWVEMVGVVPVEMMVLLRHMRLMCWQTAFAAVQSLQ